MQIFHNPNYNFIRWRWHAIALSLAIIIAGARADGHARPAARHRLLGRHAGRVQFEQPVTEDQVRARAQRRFPATRSCSSSARPADRQIMIRLPQIEHGRAGHQPRAGVAADRGGAAEGGACRSSSSSPRDIVGPVDRRRPPAQGHLRHAGLDPRDHALHRRPLPSQLRRRRHRGDVPRHPGHAGVPGVLRVRPVAQRRRGHPHHHRLLGERHHRHLRPRAREHAVEAARAARTGGQHRRQPDVVRTIITAGTTFLSVLALLHLRRRGAARASRSRCSWASSAAPTRRCSSPRRSPSS